MKSADNLPEIKKHELAFVVDLIRNAFAFTVQRDHAAVRWGRLLKTSRPCCGLRQVRCAQAPPQ
jgi:hypothetical protein